MSGYEERSRSSNVGNFDDFEQLDNYSLHEQPEAEERESEELLVGDGDDDHYRAHSRLPDSPPVVYNADDLLLNFGGGNDSTALPVGLQSTARPLMTAGVDHPTEVCMLPPEVTEIHLTPDPADDHRTAEPFVNIASAEHGGDHLYRDDLDPPTHDGVTTSNVADQSPSAPDESLFFEDDSTRISSHQGGVVDNEHFTKSSVTESEQHLPVVEPPSRHVMEEEPVEKKHQVTKDETEPATTPGRCPFRFCAWFKAENLDPRVADLLYWRDVKKTGIAFGSGLVVLLALACFSLISVVAYLLLAVMVGTLSYRIYKNVLQAVQKSGEGHPFKAYLDFDLNLPRDKLQETIELIVKHLESSAKQLRRLFLVEDLVDSLKFAVMLWCCTYIGAWFNGLTLFTLGYVAVFTLPKFYETYKTEIDHYLSIVATQVNEIISKAKAKIPIGKKQKEQ